METTADGPARPQPRVCVCLLNWNGWEDTVECLESVLRLEHVAYQTVVVDNGSTDGSAERLEAWARGRMEPMLATPDALRGLIFPRVAKPVPHRSCGAAEFASRAHDELSDAHLLLVRNGENLGFAGGLNVALRYALRSDRFDFVWLLNNDTVVPPDSLRRLVSRMRAEPELGLCGSTLLFYDEPQRVQALGGFRYNVWSGRSKPIGQLERYDDLSPAALVAAERRMFGVQGASVLVSMPFLRSVGLLAEDYFLYFEEQDWAVRARRAGFGIGYAPESVVYHKEGRSTGNHSRARSDRSMASDFYQVQARLLFTRKFYPHALPTVYLSLLGVMTNRVRRRQVGHAAMIARLAFRMLRAPGSRRFREESRETGRGRESGTPLQET